MDLIRRRCRDCGRVYAMTFDEIDKYKQRKMVPPKRCKQCRKIEIISQKLKGVRKVLGKVYDVLVPRQVKVLTKPEKGAKVAKPKLQKKSSKRKSVKKKAGK